MLLVSVDNFDPQIWITFMDKIYYFKILDDIYSYKTFLITFFTWLICVDDSAPQIWIILLDKTYPTLTGCLLSPSALTWLCLKSSPSATFFKYIRCTSFALGLNQLWKLLTFGCCCYAKSCHKHILFLQYSKNEEILSFL